jgi:hypothetical protein
VPCAARRFSASGRTLNLLHFCLIAKIQTD